MRRVRLVDPLAQVTRVAQRRLRVTTQAAQDEATAELERYRDTDDPVAEAPLVSGSTADGTALSGLLDALDESGAIIADEESVEDNLATPRVVGDTGEFNDATVARRIEITSDNSVAQFAVLDEDGLRVMNVDYAANNPNPTDNNRAVELFGGTNLGVWSGTDNTALPKFFVQGSTGDTTIDGKIRSSSLTNTFDDDLAVEGNALITGRTNLGSFSGNPSGVATGDIWYRTDHKALAGRMDGITGNLYGRVYRSLANSSAISNTTSQTAFDENASFPGNSITGGRVMRFSFWGLYEIAAATTPTIRYRVRFAEQTSPVTNRLVFDFGAVTVSANGWFSIDGEMIWGSAADSSSIFGAARLVIGAGDTTNGATANAVIRLDRASVTTIAAYSVDRNFEVTAQWGTASASNTTTLNRMIVDWS